MYKRLTKSHTDKKLAGVLGGLAEYFNIDPTIARLIFLVITVFTGFVPCIFAYLIAAMIIPEH